MFGGVGRDAIDNWLSRHVRARLGSDVSRVVFRSGRIAAVYGAGYPCPAPLDGPSSTDGLTAVIETLLTDGEPGNGHEPGTRRAMARALFDQIQLLRGAEVDNLLAGAPAWSHYERGPWPTPHDPIFDFTVTPAAFIWLDDLARRAASVLQQAGPPDAIAHAEWNCGNARFQQGVVSASYDWDSLAAGPEPVLVGMSAGSFTRGSTAGATCRRPARRAHSSSTTRRSGRDGSANLNNVVPRRPSPGSSPTTRAAESASSQRTSFRLTGRRCWRC